MSTFAVAQLLPMPPHRVIIHAALDFRGGDSLGEREATQHLKRSPPGDDDAFAALFKEHETRISRLMWRFTRDRNIQVELVQEAFVQAYLSLPRFKDRGTPMENWLVKIATRVGYQFWKSQARQRRTQSLNGLDFPAAAPASPMEPREAAQKLHELLAMLPPADRLVLTLMYFEEAGIEQIAKQCGWNRAMVKMRLYRARNRLKAIIERKKMTDFFAGAIHGTA